MFYMNVHCNMISRYFALYPRLEGFLGYTLFSSDLHI